MKNKQIYIYAIIGVVFLAIVLYIISEKNKKDKELEELKANINSGVGENQNDVNVFLTGVIPEYYATVDADVTKLQKADGSWYWDDDEKAIYAVLENKTKAQLKGLSIRLEAKTGKNLNQWLENVLDAGTEIEKAKLIIRNAK